MFAIANTKTLATLGALTMEFKNDKELLEACRPFLVSAQWIAEREFENPDNEFYQDPGLLAAAERTGIIIQAIDDALSTRH